MCAVYKKLCVWLNYLFKFTMQWNILNYPNITLTSYYEPLELKLKYYHLMVKLDMNEKKYLQVSKHYQQINQTPIVTKDEAKVPQNIEFFENLFFIKN